MKKNTQIEFRSINDAKVLNLFLEDKGKRHKIFHHYTSLETLQKMLEKDGRKLFLTRMDKLNDALECRNDPDKQKRTYVASFSFGKAESIAMWSMYGIGKEGIRLRIPLRAITKTIKDFRKEPVIYFTTDPTKKIADAEIVKLKMMDVVYAHPGSLEYNKEKILNDKNDKEYKKIKKFTDASELAFCIKNEVWLSENETRMILELKKVLPGNIEQVAIDFGPAVDELEVTGSPCISREELLQKLKNLDEKRVKESFAYNKVYFKDCKGCNKKTPFCKENKKESGK